MQDLHSYPLSGCAGLLHGKASHLVLRSLSLPYEPSSLATPIQGGRIKRSTFTLGIMWHSAEHP